MDFESIWNGAISTIKALWVSAPAKFVISILMAMVMHKHAILFYAFVCLVFLDCFTRWMSISYEHLYKLYNEGVEDEEQFVRPSIWETIVGIKEARKCRLISSTVMKHRFLGKISVYLICVLAAASTDLVMQNVGTPTWAVACIIGYLTLTELLSIVENLNDAGIEAVRGLVDIVKLRKDAIK